MSALLAQLRQIDLGSLLFAILDIAIVSFFIYRVLLLIRGTRAAYMLTGLLLLAGFYFASSQLSLATVNWLLDHVINYIIIIVIIVFQADIRRGLSRMGRRMVAPSRSNDDVTVIDEVVAACDALAKSTTGALIVFEREGDLSEIATPGTALDARVSKALLVNIFTPWAENPLHDGAAILKGPWVQQAGAVLPLSRNPGLDKALGTRHRAGVGVTEETDAVAIVVSEQRGSISLCVGGVLHMGLNGAALRRELLALLVTAERSRWHWLDKLMRRWERAIGTVEERPMARRRVPRKERASTESLASRPPE